MQVRQSVHLVRGLLWRRVSMGMSVALRARAFRRKSPSFVSVPIHIPCGVARFGTGMANVAILRRLTIARRRSNEGVAHSRQDRGGCSQRNDAPALNTTPSARFQAFEIDFQRFSRSAISCARR